jgi:hypothetical protein
VFCFAKFMDPDFSATHARFIEENDDVLVEGYTTTAEHPWGSGALRVCPPCLDDFAAEFGWSIEKGRRATGRHIDRLVLSASRRDPRAASRWPRPPRCSSERSDEPRPPTGPPPLGSPLPLKRAEKLATPPALGAVLGSAVVVDRQ